MSTAASSDTSLLDCQQKAIAHLRAEAISLKPTAMGNLNNVLRMSNLSSYSLDLILASIRQHARVTLHFHPDRPVGSHTVARGLLEDGIYKSQFETGISNGSVSAHHGGARDAWEHSLFNGAYHVDGVEPAHRPKYGALDLMRNSDGPAPRFGSCFFVLKPEVSARSTFTMGGSEAGPKYLGTIDEFHAIMAALFEECFTRDFVLGVGNIRPVLLMERILELGTALKNPSDRSPSRNLDYFVEAQVHGEVLLGRDIEKLVVDSSFCDTDIARDLEALSAKYKFPLQWRQGSRLKTRDVPVDFRGPTMPSLAVRVAKDDIVDAERIGRAVRELSKDAGSWEDRGTYPEVLQELKLLWHVLVRFGKETM